MKAEPQRLAFEFKVSPEYKVFAVNGVLGGLNAFGDLIVSFYCERTAIPRKQVFELTKAGLGELPIEEEKTEAIIRDVMLGVSMNPKVAKSVGKWLIQRADQFDSIMLEAAGDEDA